MEQLIEAEIERLKSKQPEFYAELLRQGFEPCVHRDDKTGNLFVGWSIRAGEFETSRGIGEAINKAYEREEKKNRQANKSELPEGTITVEMFTRVDGDVYGNPRYYIPVYHFGNLTNAQRSKAGLTKYRGKRYGAGYVVQSYNLESTCNRINKTLCPHNYCDDDAKCINCGSQL